MGNQESSSWNQVETVNKMVTDIVLEASQNCKSSNTSVQEMVISKLTGAEGCEINISDITQSSNLKTNFDCINDQELAASLGQDLTKKLTSAAVAETSGLSGAMNSEAHSANIQKSVVDIKNNLNVKLLSECLSDNLTAQKMKIGEIRCGTNGKITIDNINQTIVGTAVAKCFADQQSANSAITKLDEQFVASSEAKNTGIQIVSACGGSSIVLCLILSLISSIMIMRGGKSGMDMNEIPSSGMNNGMNIDKGEISDVLELLKYVKK